MRAEDSGSLLLAGVVLAGGLAVAAWAPWGIALVAAPGSPAAGSWQAWRAMPDLAAWSPAATDGAGRPAVARRPARGPGLADGMGPSGRALSGGGKPSLAGPLDLNRASAPALIALPGVGPALARRIVAHREAHGPFRRPEDLIEVPGIRPKRYARLKDWVSVR